MPKCKMILMTLIFCLTASVRITAQVDDLDKYVYMVRIPATSHHNKPALQTGFRLAGRKGIITALHGVADGTTFSAYNEMGDVLNNLKIASVDVDNDVALLRSEEIENRLADGLQAVGNLAINSGDALRVAGHPEGINLYIKDDAKAGTPVFKELHMLISADSADLFDRRQSPKTDITILNISSGNLGPGFSGAPVLNSSNQVVAIVDGGLRDGALAISWAIPITKVAWRDISSARTLINHLATLDTTNLFSYTPYNSVTVDSPTLEETMTFIKNSATKDGWARDIISRERGSVTGSFDGCSLHLVGKEEENDVQSGFQLELLFSFADLDPEASKVVEVTDNTGKEWQVRFYTTNNKEILLGRSIRQARGHPPENTSSYFADDAFVYGDKESADKMMKAMKHAIELCGGKVGVY